MSLFNRYLKHLSLDGLYLVYQDATNRIGSHYPGSCPDTNYIKKQESILASVQEELLSRNMKIKGEM